MRRLTILLCMLFCVIPIAVSAQSLPPINPATVSGDISTAGSSTLARLTDVIATRFGLEGYLGTIGIDPSGTAAAFQRFCAGEIDIVLADRQITQPELNACTVSGRSPLAFRIATDAVVVVVSRQNNFAVDVTAAELQQIFSTANQWSDIRAGWPAEAILRYGPGSTSEEFALFASAVFGGDTRPLATAIGAQYNDDLNIGVQGIATATNAIGFFDVAFTVNNSSLLQSVAVDSIQPNAENISRTAYPLARPLILYSAASVMAEKPQVASFINYYVTNSQTEVAARGLFAPPAGALEAAANVWLSAMGQPVVSQPTPPPPAATEVVAETGTTAEEGELPEEQAPVVEETTTTTQGAFSAEVQSVLVNSRLDLEVLAAQRLGNERPEGWTASLDVNNPQLPLLLRLDTELLAAVVYGVDARPANWFGAVTSTQAAISRDIRHDVELLADTIFGQDFRPGNWTGDNPLYRCDRATQALADILLRTGAFTLSANPADENYCDAAALDVSLFAEVNLLQASSGGTTSAPVAVAPGSATVNTAFAVAFLNRNATQQAGVIPQGTPLTPIARSYVRFSNMMLVQGEGFLLFVEYQNTSITTEQFDALPDESQSTYETACSAEWCSLSE